MKSHPSAMQAQLKWSATLNKMPVSGSACKARDLTMKNQRFRTLLFSCILLAHTAKAQYLATGLCQANYTMHFPSMNLLVNSRTLVDERYMRGEMNITNSKDHKSVGTRILIDRLQDSGVITMQMNTPQLYAITLTPAEVRVLGQTAGGIDEWSKGIINFRKVIEPNPVQCGTSMCKRIEMSGDLPIQNGAVHLTGYGLMDLSTTFPLRPDGVLREFSMMGGAADNGVKITLDGGERCESYAIQAGDKVIDTSGMIEITGAEREKALQGIGGDKH